MVVTVRIKIHIWDARCMNGEVLAESSSVGIKSKQDTLFKTPFGQKRGRLHMSH